MAQPFLAQSAVLRIGAFDDKTDRHLTKPADLKLTFVFGIHLECDRHLCIVIKQGKSLESRLSSAQSVHDEVNRPRGLHACCQAGVVAQLAGLWTRLVEGG